VSFDDRLRSFIRNGKARAVLALFHALLELLTGGGRKQ